MRHFREETGAFEPCRTRRRDRLTAPLSDHYDAAARDAVAPPVNLLIAAAVAFARAEMPRRPQATRREQGGGCVKPGT